MKKSTYRAIVLASMLIPVAGLCLDSFCPLIPASLKSVYDSMVQFGGIKSYPPGVWLAMVVVVVTTLASITHTRLQNRPRKAGQQQAD